MSEAEWLATNKPDEMFRELYRHRISGRKQRLFIVGCCRKLGYLFEQHPPIRECVEFAEGYADSHGAKKRLKKLHDANKKLYERWGGKPSQDVSVAHVASMARGACDADIIFGPWIVSSFSLAIKQQVEFSDPEWPTNLLRDIFGNPFRPVVFDPAWLTPTVTSLASSIYADRAFDRMPMLADALEEAGCDHADILLHCRGDGPHVRGCWVVDAILGKE
jgi:hypothetical protein